jgi:uncharacterized protein YjbI with pentapeptide repeats
MDSQLIQLSETKIKLDVKRAMMDGSYFEDIRATDIKITNANLSDLEIEGAQLGGAYIHNIGMPPKGHPLYDPEVKQRPLKFEDCELSESTITNCNLTGVSIDKCELKGMKINGILVEDLLNAYHR